MKRRAVLALGALAALAAVAAASVAVVWALGPRTSAPQLPSPQDGITLAARTATRSAFFGDAIVATATAVVDTRTVDPASLRLRGDFAPFRVEHRSRQARTSGHVLLLRASWTLDCLDPGCLPGKTSHAFSWAPVELDYRLRRSSLPRALTQPFEPVTILTRVTPAEVTRPRFRGAPPVVEAPRYAISPRLLTVLLVAAGATLVLAALALAGYALVGLRRRRVAAADPLQLVLAELGRATRANGDSARRRRALERLAELVETDDEELGGATRTLAWAPADPPPDAIEELARRAREARG